MLLRFAADLIVILHLAFIIFVILGGLLVLRWRWVMFLHIPAAIWGALIEFQGWYCPLTPLEQKLRRSAGEVAYEGGFVGHYILPIIYPEQLTHNLQLVLGSIVVVTNIVIYAVILRRSSPAHATQ